MRNVIVLQYLFDDLDEVVWDSEMKGKSFRYVCFFLKNLRMTETNDLNVHM